MSSIEHCFALASSVCLAISDCCARNFASSVPHARTWCATSATFGLFVCRQRKISFCAIPLVHQREVSSGRFHCRPGRPKYACRPARTYEVRIHRVHGIRDRISKHVSSFGNAPNQTLLSVRPKGPNGPEQSQNGALTCRINPYTSTHDESHPRAR